MHLSLHHKLALIFTLIILLISATLFFTFQSSFKHGFNAYLTELRINDANRLATQISTVITSPAQWERFVATPRNWDELQMHTLQSQKQPFTLSTADMPPRHPPPPERHHNKHQPEKRPSHPPHRAPRGAPPRPPTPFVLLDYEQTVLFRSAQQPQPNWHKVAIIIQAQTLGFIAVKPVNNAQTQTEQAFIQQQLTTLFWIALIAMLSTILLSWPIARYLTKPIAQLATAAKKIAQKDYHHTVDIRSKDDIGELAAAFNHMVDELNKHETLQKNWISDISHELRTPIAIMRAEIEATQDGVRKISPQLIDSMHKEVMQLTRLIEDLHDITVSDRGERRLEKTAIPIFSFLDNHFTSRQLLLDNKRLSFSIEPSKSKRDESQLLYADPVRLDQLFSNLTQNSLRYTDSGGQILCWVNIDKHKPNTITIAWEDSGPGVPQEALDKLFNRLYRVEKSRSRETGGHGLGLAICKHIVTCHGGTIAANHSKLGGLQILITLPINNKDMKQ